MGRYFTSKTNYTRTRYELNLIKLVKSYEHFMGEINRLSKIINTTHSVGKEYDNYIISLRNNMLGLVESVDLYACRIGLISKMQKTKNLPLSLQVENIICSKNINDFIEKYSKIIKSDKSPIVKRRKMLISQNFKTQLKEAIEKIDIDKTSNGYVARVKATLGSVVEKVYGKNLFDIPTCGIMPNMESRLNLKSPLPYLIEKDFARLGLENVKKQEKSIFGEISIRGKKKNTSVLGYMKYGQNVVRDTRQLDSPILGSRIFVGECLERNNGR